MYRLNTPTHGFYADGKEWRTSYTSIDHVGQTVRLTPWKPEVADGPEYFCDTRRICLAPTIEQCLIGISQWGVSSYRQVDELSDKPLDDDEFWWALEPIGSPMLHTPPHGVVPDVDDTDEVWILEPWDFLVIGRIQIYWRALTRYDTLEWKFVEGGF